MPIFRVKARTWESYVAGIGASSVLIASGIAMFVIMVGVVTFKTWPDAGDLLGRGGGDIALRETAPPAPAGSAAGRSTPNLVKLGGGRPGASHGAGTHARGPGKVGLTPGGNVELPGGSTGTPGGPGQPQDSQPPRSGSTQTPNVIGQAVSGIGNTVQGDTKSLGDSLNTTTGTNLGSAVTGVGNTVNKDLQVLAGNG
jgi:hypothetical protein